MADINYKVINTSELKGSNFRARRINFKNYDISNAQFEVSFFIKNSDDKIAGTYFKEDNILVVPFKPIEDKRQTWTVDLWMIKNGDRDKLIRWNVLITDEAIEVADDVSLDLTLNFIDEIIEVEIQRNVVEMKLGWEYLTEPQKQWLQEPAKTAGTNAQQAANTANSAAQNANTAANKANAEVSILQKIKTDVLNFNKQGATILSALQTFRTNAENYIEQIIQAISSAITATNSANQAVSEVNLVKGQAETAIQNANTAAGNADNAASSANDAANNANEKATQAHEAILLTEQATDNANEKAGLANTAALNADEAALNANEAAGSVTQAITNANNAAGLADEKAGLAVTAAQNANNKAELANTAAQGANTAKAAADTATGNANIAIGNANAAASNANQKASEADAAKTAALNAADVANNAKGWQPLLVADTTTIAGKTLLKLSDWIGGTGTKPTTNVGQWQTAAGGYTATAASALDLNAVVTGNVVNKVTDLEWAKRDIITSDFTLPGYYRESDGEYRATAGVVSTKKYRFNAGMKHRAFFSNQTYSTVYYYNYSGAHISSSKNIGETIAPPGTYYVAFTKALSEPLPIQVQSDFWALQAVGTVVEDFTWATKNITEFPLVGQYYATSNGVVANSVTYSSTVRFRTKEGMRFKNRFAGTSIVASAVFFKADGSFLSSVINQSEIITPNGAYYIAFSKTSASTEPIQVQSDFWALQENDLLVDYTHTSNKEVYCTGLDLATGTFTSVGHGLLNNQTIFPTYNNDFTGNPFSVYPTGMIEPDYRGFKTTDVTSDTFKIIRGDNNAPLTFTSLGDFSKWHFERSSAGTLFFVGLPTFNAFRLVFNGKKTGNTSFHVWTDKMGFAGGPTWLKSDSNLLSHPDPAPGVGSYKAAGEVIYYLKGFVTLISRALMAYYVTPTQLSTLYRHQVASSTIFRDIPSNQIAVACPDPMNGFSIKIYKIE